jgi:foldase protein PrsA
MRRRSIIIGLLIFALAGCTRSAITVDGEQISKEAFEYALKEKIGAHKAMNVDADSEAVKKAVTEELIAQALLVREAKSRKISVTDEEVHIAIEGMRGGISKKEFIEGLKKNGLPYNIFQNRVRSNLLVAKLMDSLVREEALTEEDMYAFYLERPERYVHPVQVYVKILQMSDEADAEKVSEESKQGADFDTVAKNMADAGSASVSDYGWINPDMLPSKELADVMKTAEIDVVSGPFQGRDKSYYFFKVRERKESRELTFEEAKPRVRTYLLQKMRRDLAAHIVQSGRKTATIEINM